MSDSYAELKARKRLRGAKRRAKNSSLPSPSKPIRKANRKRKQSEFARCYGSKARVEWVKQQPCVACSCVPCDNAHISTGGAGRKAHFTKIVPLCSPFYDEIGCHRHLHAVGRRSFEWTHAVDLEQAARDTEARWQEWLRATGAPESAARGAKEGR